VQTPTSPKYETKETGGTSAGGGSSAVWAQKMHSYQVSAAFRLRKTITETLNK
jgi:hypothetical protein